MKNQLKVLILVVFSLCLGVLIYTTTRTEELYLNQWLASIGGNNIKSYFDQFYSVGTFPPWVIYSLPDALWMMALTLLLLLVWNFQLNKHSWPLLIMAILIGIFFEVAQGLSIINGTFDPVDLFAIYLGAAVPILFTLLKSSLWKVKQNQFYP